jgi:hypothetical protein
VDGAGRLFVIVEVTELCPPSRSAEGTAQRACRSASHPIVDWQFGIPATLAMAGLVLVVGRNLIGRLLRSTRYPSSSSGLWRAACQPSACRGCKPADTALQPGLMLAFFADRTGRGRTMFSAAASRWCCSRAASSECW